MTIWLLWTGAGQPEGSERVLLEQLQERFSKRRTPPVPTLP
jgi:hypothetical protein